MTEAKRVPGYVCPQCNWFDVFQVTCCPRCNRPVQETLFSGRGKVASFTVIRYPPTGFEKESPYVVALVDIEDGPRVMARIAAKPEEVQIGSSVSFLGNSTGKLEFTL
jgi:hypothetical protein